MKAEGERGYVMKDEIFSVLQRVGRSFMLPVAILPIAGILLGIGASAMLAQLTMTHAYAVGRKFTVAALAYLTVVFSTLSGIVLFNEQIGWQEWLGIGIIIAGGILSGLKK